MSWVTSSAVCFQSSASHWPPRLTSDAMPVVDRGEREALRDLGADRVEARDEGDAAAPPRLPALIAHPDAAMAPESGSARRVGQVWPGATSPVLSHVVRDRWCSRLISSNSVRCCREATELGGSGRGQTSLALEYHGGVGALNTPPVASRMFGEAFAIANRTRCGAQDHRLRKIRRAALHVFGSNGSPLRGIDPSRRGEGELRLGSPVSTGNRPLPVPNPSADGRLRR